MRVKCTESRGCRTTENDLDGMTLTASTPDRWPQQSGSRASSQGPQRQNCILARRIFNSAVIWFRGVGDNFIHSTNIFTAYHVQSFQNKVTVTLRREWRTDRARTATVRGECDQKAAGPAVLHGSSHGSSRRLPAASPPAVPLSTRGLRCVSGSPAFLTLISTDLSGSPRLWLAQRPSELQEIGLGGHSAHDANEHHPCPVAPIPELPQDRGGPAGTEHLGPRHWIE